MRRLLLFSVLSIVATLILSPTALAQQSGPAFNFLDVPEGTPPCPLGLDEVKEIYGPNVTCGEGGGYVLNTSDSSTPPATSSPTVTQVGEGNVACVQTAVQTEVNKTQINQHGDNVNIQNIAQECNISVEQVNTVISSVTAKATASASASVSAKASASASSSASATASATSAPAAVQYQYAAPQVQYSATTASPAAALPSTGGSSLIALGAGVLLVAGGLLARRIVR